MSLAKKKLASHPYRSKALADALAGVIGSLAALSLFYPIDVWKTRVQSGLTNFQQPRCTLGEIFAGLPLKALHTCSSSFCYFYLYSWIVSCYTATTQRRGGKLDASRRLLLSAVAAMLNTFLTLPLDVLSAQMQAKGQKTRSGRKLLPKETQDVSEDDEEEEDAVGDEKKGDQEGVCSGRTTCQQTASCYVTNLSSLTSLWKGLLPSLYLCTNPALNYTIYDSIKMRVLKPASSLEHPTSPVSLSVLQAFLLGLVAKFSATMITYPLIRAKVMLIVTSRTSLLGCLVDEYRRDGVRGLYTGCNLQLLHTLLKSAMLMVIRERLTQTTQRIVDNMQS